VTVELVASPGQGYIEALRRGLADATSFVLVTAFASQAGLDLVEPLLEQVLARGGQGRLVVAVDRRGFNATGLFESLLRLKTAHSKRLSVGVVMEDQGLLHAKALFTQSPTGDRLIVGSANLTARALGINHELGVALGGVEGNVRHAFHQFVNSIAPRSLDGEDARAFLEKRGLLERRLAATAPAPARPQTTAPLAEAFGRLERLPPLDEVPEQHLAGWIRQGYLVGRGRRTLDALVLRLPQEQLVRAGYIRPPRREVIGASSHETRSMGYGVDLIPTAQAEVLRRDARRVSLLLSKMTLNLPCFGLWMPASYWDVFVAARDGLRAAHDLTPERIREVATTHRQYLLGDGLAAELDLILARLTELDILVDGRGDALRGYLLPRLQRELQLRTPDVLASCLEFRTARQTWNPHEQTEAPFRQLMVDLVQAVFAATYRTGDWPRRFRSHAARQLAVSIEDRLEEGGGEADASTATSILDWAATWESPDRPMEVVIEEFRQIIRDEVDFPPPALDDLIDTGGEDDEEEGGGA